MMSKLVIAVVFAALGQSALPGTPFRPWGSLGYRTINAIEFSRTSIARLDYAVSITGSPERIVWKRRNGTFSTEWAPLLAAARARSVATP